jgi:hypothetical protein
VLAARDGKESEHGRVAQHVDLVVAHADAVVERG